MASTNTVRHEGLDYPTGPGRTYDYWDLPSSPSVANRWFRYQTSTVEMNVIWMGDCAYCGGTVWKELDLSPETLAEQLATQNVFSPVVDEDNDITYTACYSCTSTSTRKARVLASGRANPEVHKVREWPESAFTVYREKIAEERAKQARWIEAQPTEPKPGAYVWLIDKNALAKFRAWDKDKAVVDTGTKVKSDTMLTLLPAIHGVPHSDVVLLPSAGRLAVEKPTRWEILRWSGLTVTMRRKDDGVTHSFKPDVIAVAAPSVNPETETVEQRAERLQNKLDRVEHAMHARLVAEGVARSWCATFDPILDAQGLNPRSAKVIVTGTATFTHEFEEKSLKNGALDALTSGRDVLSYVPAASFQFDGIKVERPEVSRQLS